MLTLAILTNRKFSKKQNQESTLHFHIKKKSLSKTFITVLYVSVLHVFQENIIRNAGINYTLCESFQSNEEAKGKLFFSHFSISSFIYVLGNFFCFSFFSVLLFMCFGIYEKKLEINHAFASCEGVKKSEKRVGKFSVFQFFLFLLNSMCRVYHFRKKGTFYVRSGMWKLSYSHICTVCMCVELFLFGRLGWMWCDSCESFGKLIQNDRNNESGRLLPRQHLRLARSGKT